MTYKKFLGRRGKKSEIPAWKHWFAEECAVSVRSARLAAGAGHSCRGRSNLTRTEPVLIAAVTYT